MNSDVNAEGRDTHCLSSFEGEPDCGVEVGGFLSRDTKLERIELVDAVDETGLRAVVFSRLVLATCKQTFRLDLVATKDVHTRTVPLGMTPSVSRRLDHSIALCTENIRIEISGVARVTHLVPKELIVQLLVIRASGKFAADSDDGDGYFCGHCL